MISMLDRLKSLETPIRIGVIGTGSVGQGILYQAGLTPGVECVAVCDVNGQKAVEAAELAQREYRVVRSAAEAEDAIGKGTLAILEDGQLLATCESLDVLVESSSAIGQGGRHAAVALENRTHVVMMNAEADLVFSPYLMELGRKNGVVYTSCDGDQPGVIRRVIDDVQLWGFDVVMAGNVKGFLDRYSNPTTIAPEADKRFLDHRMCASYTDGSKLGVEMALVANAFGYEVDTPGMHGPRCQHILDLLDLFDLKRVYRDHPQGVMDYVLGPIPKGGVFVVGYSDSAYQKKMLGWFPVQLGDGPFYVFRRPYHLIHLETMRCIAEAFLDGDALLQPWHGFKTNVYCYAKRDLKRGDTLDGLGGYACYGLIENCADQRDKPGFPICLAENVTVRRDIPKDEKVFWDDVDHDPNRADFEMYAQAVEAAESRAS
jgi:predicted homoserine dehydrogenase-like protein